MGGAQERGRSRAQEAQLCGSSTRCLPACLTPRLNRTPCHLCPPPRPGVIAGAVLGHGIATVIAVLGGSFLGRYLDEKVVQYVGGSLFLVSARGVGVGLGLS